MKTEVFKWKEEYSVGLSTVDKQHKRFLEILNLLGDCIANRNYKEKGQQIFFSLMNFADEYLFKEKMLVANINDLDYSFFREKHNEFLGKLKFFKDSYAENPTEEVFIDLYNYLKMMYPDYLAHYTPTLVKILKDNGIN